RRFPGYRPDHRALAGRRRCLQRPVLIYQSRQDADERSGRQRPLRDTARAMTTSGADRLSVLLTTEGTYPYHGGGVSTWCDALTKQLSEVDFTLLAVTMHPYLAPKYELAANVKEVLTVPLWGTEDPAEYGRHVSFLEYLER